MPKVLPSPIVMKKINVFFISPILAVLLLLATAFLLSSCTGNYQQVVIREQVQAANATQPVDAGQQQAKAQSSQDFTIPKPSPLPSPDAKQPSDARQQSPEQNANATSATVPQQSAPFPATTSTTTTTTLTQDQQQFQIEQKYGSTLDLTKLNAQNCDSVLVDVQSKISDLSDSISYDKQDLDTEQSKLNDLISQLAAYRQEQNSQGIELVSRKVASEQDKVDTMSKSLDDEKNYLQELQDTRKTVSEECIKLKYLAGNAG